MASPIHHMTVIHYPPDGGYWTATKVLSPTWTDVEHAIRRMDNFHYPRVELSLHEEDTGEDEFNICGGSGRWALFQIMGDWQYEDPAGSEKEARLWESDQGYYCMEKNILTDIEKVLLLTKVFYDTGSYEALAATPP